MPFQAVPNTWGVKLVYNYGTGPDIISDFHVRNVPGAKGTAEAQSLADAFEAYWNSDIKALQVTAITLTRIEVKDLGQQFGARVLSDVGTTGSVATAPAVSVAAALVHYVGNPGGAPRQGTVFHPGIAEASINDQAIEGAYRTAVQAAYDGLRTNPAFAVADALVIVSRYSGSTLKTRANGTVYKSPTPRSPALTNTIAATTVPLRIGVQKRRRPSPL